MPQVTRLGDFCTGHSTFYPRPSVQGSETVYANGLPIHRVSDLWAPHAGLDSPPHSSNLFKGSATVRVNGLSAGRVGDPIVCGSFVATGSPNVLIGE